MRIQELEDPKDGSVPISFKVRQANYQQLRRKVAFHTGTPLSSKAEFNDLGQTMDFHGVPDIIPVERYTPYTLEQLEKKRIEKLKAEESKDTEQLRVRSKEQLADISSFPYERSYDPAKKDFMSRFKVIRKRHQNFAKPIVAIFNPAAGRANDVRELINIRFEFLDIKVEYQQTLNPFHAFEIAKGLDFNSYSAMMIIGGDGTISEAVNGMLARKDKKRLPIGLVPNGYSNDICHSLGIKNIDQALDFILKRETIAIDTIRCLIDREDEKKLPAGPERMLECRYMLAGA